ncbi:Retrovirus-related Pol polyprotein from transposon TNT 1-94 Includes: ame: Full=Protease [Lentinula edodes]|uniref:Protease n=1 Tax=Lentinula edodes TaxID=5353 RepID=A0A1Q3E8Y6_LENED|nr:Retrovirus-related Pol polyprotein from transposon TNT 1-94 Includes: ame: Full=Protease [Lentinula edodes]
MSTGSMVNIPRLPDEKQLIDEDNWRPFKPNPNHRKLPEVNISGGTNPGVQCYTVPRGVGSLGVDKTKRASEIWQSLIKRFEKHDEQRIHLAETSLRHKVFDPLTDTMEAHEKKMRNLLRKVHDLGGTMTDAQFRQITIFSMPPDWRQDVRTVPGTSSTEAFTYLQTLWYQREEERKEEERDMKRVKALMAAHAYPQMTHGQPRDQPRTGGRSSIICHNCNKAGHIAKKCWAKGGGMEGQGPRQNAKPRVNTNSNATITDKTEFTSPMATYVMSVKANSDQSKLIPF